MPRPDALRWPKDRDLRTIRCLEDSQLRVLGQFADEHLQAGPREFAHVHDARPMHYFASRNPHDTLLDPETRKPRYRWEPRTDGLEYGYLIDGPKTS